MNTRSKLLDVLQELHTKSRTGVLRIQRDTKKKQLVLHNGLLAFAESNLPEEHLAHVMVTMNIIPRAKLNEVASSMKGGLTSEEAILALPEFNPLDLEKGRREQAILIASSLFGWEGCDFRLHAGVNQVRYQSSLRMSLPELAIASLRRAVSKRLLPLPQSLLREKLVALEETPSQQMPLNPAERKACSLLKSERPAEEIISSIPDGELKPEQTLFVLYHLGLITYIADRHDAAEIDEFALDSNPLVMRLNEMLALLDSASLYEILSVSPDATQDQIQAAYHEQAKQLHPDRFQTGEFTPRIRIAAEQVFAKINEAYHTLKNSNSRKLYDLELPKKRPGAAQPKGAVIQNAETAEGLFREGKSLLAKGDAETAVERLRGSVWLCPDKASYNYYLGLAEARIPKFRKSAEQHFLKAIEIEDTSAECHLALARLYIDVRLPRKAELQLDQVLLWDPNNSEAHTLAAELKKLH